MDTKKVWLWLWLLLITVVVAAAIRVPSARAAETSSNLVYIYKEIGGSSYRQENLRVKIKSQYSFIISLRVGTASGNSQWINFNTAAGSSSYQADLIEIPLNKSLTDGKWHDVEILDLKSILTQSGDIYDHLEKIGIRGTTFQLGDIDLFSGDIGSPVDLQVISFDNPAASNMNQYGWYSHDNSAQFTLRYQAEGNYLQVTGQPSTTTGSTSTPAGSTSTSTSSAQAVTTTSSASSNSAASSQAWAPFPTSSNYYPSSAYSSAWSSGPYSSTWSSDWSSGPAYPVYIPPLPSPPPLFGLGYPPGLPPYGFGPQPILSLLTMAGLPSYYNDPNPGYPYSVGGLNFSTLFATGSSPYPYVSPFTAQTYGYLAAPLAPVDPTYNIYNASVTSTLAPAAAISGLLYTFTGGGLGGGGGGIGGGGGFAGGALI